MRIFICGTGTDIGKTLVCNWLCLHTKHSYWKPIQTGNIFDSDSKTIERISGAKIHPEVFSYTAPLSPHLSAELENREINLAKIILPDDKNLVIEGAGGVMVPLNKSYLIIDLIKYLRLPTLIVASSALGTINHTLLTIEALRGRNIEIKGVIMSGDLNQDNADAIEYYGNVDVVGQIPKLDRISKNDLLKIRPGKRLISIFEYVD
jgi:dethiobiotin synthetase